MELFAPESIFPLSFDSKYTCIHPFSFTPQFLEVIFILDRFISAELLIKWEVCGIFIHQTKDRGKTLFCMLFLPAYSEKRLADSL